MNNKISTFFNGTKKFITKHSPEILTGLGLSSMVTSTILAVKATPKAVKKIQDEQFKRTVNSNSDEEIKLSYKDIIKLTWKDYLPAASFGLSGFIFIVCSCNINSKRSAALASAYAMSERTLSTYRNKVIETIGEKKEKELRRKIKQDEIDKNPPQTSQVIITSKGNTLMRDTLSGRYFRSDLDTIRKAINVINRQLTYENYISLNEFYSNIGLDNVKNGDRMGWNIDDGLIELEYGTCLAENDEPCICIDYSRAPKPNFDKLF